MQLIQTFCLRICHIDSQYQISLKSITKLWMRNIHRTDLKRCCDPIILSLHVHLISVNISWYSLLWKIDSIPGQSVWDFWLTKWHSDSSSLSTSVFSFIIIPTILRTHIHLHVALTRRTSGWSQGTIQNAMLFLEIGEDYIEKDFQFFVSFTGHVTAEVVSCWPLTTEALVWSQVSPCEICCGQSDTFFSSHFGFPLSVAFHRCSIVIHSSLTDAIQC
jgi:hypothetical protein